MLTFPCVAQVNDQFYFYIIYKTKDFDFVLTHAQNFPQKEEKKKNHPQFYTSSFIFIKQIYTSLFILY